MSNAATLEAQPEVRRVVLPPGEANVLCDSQQVHNGVTSATVQFRGRSLQIQTPEAGSVLFPTDVGLSLLRALTLDRSVRLEGVRALDIGCGSGLYTVAMLSGGAAHVTALDVNPACAEVTLNNVTGNGIHPGRVNPIVGDVATLVVDQPWDVVVCNPPHFPYDPAYSADDGIETALVGGDDGRALYDIVLDRADELLEPGGTLLLTHSSLTDVPRTRDKLRKRGYECRTVQVCELDIPMRRYAAHRDVLLSRLYALRAAGRADFRGLRFEVHTLAATRPASGEGNEG
jgi:methylase of polypeptide subunit release factors